MSIAWWDFPLNVGRGQYEGLNNPGVESFKGKYWESLAREIIQNSTDARLEGVNGPVIVKFALKRSNKFPERDRLLKIFRSCRDYTKTSQKAKKFFERAIEILEEEEIYYLKISDFNTTGLTGIDHESESSDWNNLINGSGSSDKKAGSGGSFGIGKNAPFACSLLRTVFYGTKNSDGQYGFQGVSQLASHNNDENEETRGTGFYRVKETYGAIRKLDFKEVPDFFARDQIGTDVFIAGVIGAETWKTSVIKAVLENFLVAINEGNLEVHVEDEVINKDNLPSLIESYVSEDNSCLSDQYYEALLSEPMLIDFEDLGILEFHVKSDRAYSKKIAMVRDTGMKITHLDRFSGGFRFAGVMIARGEKLNEFLRQTEPPTHDKWEPSRYEENEEFAKRTLQKLNRVVRDAIKELNRLDETETAEMEGLSKFLPDQHEEESPYEEIDLSKGSLVSLPKNARIKSKKLKKVRLGNLSGERNTNGRKKNSKRNPNPNSKLNPNTNPKPGKANQVKINRIRSYCVDSEKGLFQIAVFPDTDGVGYVQIKVVGEDARTYIEPIENAVIKETNNTLPVLDDSKVGPVNFKKGLKQTLLVTFKEGLRYSLEVSVHES